MKHQAMIEAFRRADPAGRRVLYSVALRDAAETAGAMAVAIAPELPPGTDFFDFTLRLLKSSVADFGRDGTCTTAEIAEISGAALALLQCVLVASREKARRERNLS